MLGMKEGKHRCKTSGMSSFFRDITYKVETIKDGHKAKTANSQCRINKMNKLQKLLPNSST